MTGRFRKTIHKAGNYIGSWLSSRVLNRFPAVVKKLGSEARGVAAVEFALILPVMLLTYVGLVETTQFYAADRKSAIFARTLADLATQATIDSAGTGYPTITDADLNLIFSLSSAVLYPVDSSKATMRLTMYAFDSTVPALGGSNSATTPTKAFVDWSETCSVQSDGSCVYGASPKFDAANTRCDIEMVPLGVAAANSFTMRAEVSFFYTPILAGLFSSSSNGYNGLFSFMSGDGMTLADALFMRPRNNTFVVRKYTSGPKNGTSTVSPNDVATKCQPAFKP